MMWRVIAGAALVIALSACGTPARQARVEPLGSSSTLLDRSNVEQLDSCAVLTLDQAKAVTKNDVRRGRDTGAGGSCSYLGNGSDSTSLLVNLESSDSAAKFADSMALARQQTSDVQQVTGMGDEAFVYRSESSGVVSAEARVGDQRVRMVITGPNATTANALQALRSGVIFVTDHQTS